MFTNKNIAILYSESQGQECETFTIRKSRLIDPKAEIA
jgi:hypothetical protein